jgi:nicotinamidase-related amidase
VLATTAAANAALDYASFFVKGCVDTIDGPELHDAALLHIWTALGWVIASEHIAQSLLEDAR